ncbi:MAG: F420-0--gamma-glutamyl ligase [Clostridiales bacterium]|nr:F420-0--gamma-glutamyl ligase [Clostridiales bacterium]
MERLIGTVSMGVRAPIIRQGDDIAQIVVDSVVAAAKSAGLTVQDHDVIAVTEAVVARAQGNYATVDNIATDVFNKFGQDPVGVIFPILSRNRFAICLRGIAKGAALGSKKVVLMLSYPSDEVGNHLVDLDDLDAAGVNPWSDVLTEAKYRELFGVRKHTFTGVDYIEYYRELIEGCGCEAEIILANDCRSILPYTKSVLCCDIHTRARSKRLLKAAGASKVFGLDDILTASVDGSGYNENYGLLGSNKATEETIKLFPRNCQPVVDAIQKGILEQTGAHVEAMVYGDGAFKDPAGKIWELADPVVSPAYTAGLEGQPSEVKLKYLADNNFAHLEGEELKAAISQYIKEKDEALAKEVKTAESSLKGQMVSQGTTPRRLTDLIGSLSDLTSGSGDKGTPIIWIQGYFDNYTK